MKTFLLHAVLSFHTKHIILIISFSTHTSKHHSTMHTGRASGLAAADGQPPARGVHWRNRCIENSHPARTRHACGHWANPQPRCTLKLTAMRRDPRLRRRHVQRDPCRGLHRAPAPRPASSKRRRHLRRAHMPQSDPSVKSPLPHPK